MSKIFSLNSSPLLIPERFHNIPYNEGNYPGAGKKLEDGANCQFFAYELIRHYGCIIPDFRSSNLWEDKEFTFLVTNLEPLDLLLLNKTNNAWGAHVGVYLGENQILHLSKANGFPAVENVHFKLTINHEWYSP